MTKNSLKEDLDNKYKILLDIKEDLEQDIKKLTRELQKKNWMFNLVFDELTKVKKEIDELPFEIKRCSICNEQYEKETSFHNKSNVCISCAYNGRR